MLKILWACTKAFNVLRNWVYIFLIFRWFFILKYFIYCFIYHFRVHQRPQLLGLETWEWNIWLTVIFNVEFLIFWWLKIAEIIWRIILMNFYNILIKYLFLIIYLILLFNIHIIFLTLFMKTVLAKSSCFFKNLIVLILNDLWWCIYFFHQFLIFIWIIHLFLIHFIITFWT
jgi:hypothetical protein